MVDYSKWDRMDFGDSDSDGADDPDEGGPRVTSLDAPGRVTIGADGSLAIGQSGGAPPPRVPLGAPNAEGAGIPTVSGSVSGKAIDISNLKDESKEEDATAKQKRIQQWRDQLTRNGGTHHSLSTTYQKGKLPLYWSQDRYTVTLRLGFPPSEFPSKSIRVRVEGALKYSDRHSAVGSGAMSGHKSEAEGDASYGSVEVVSVSKDGGKETVLLRGELPRPIHLNQDEDEVDYEIEDNLGAGGDGGDGACTKLVSITMAKAVPMEGMVLWWDRPLVGYPATDITKIQGATGQSKQEAWKKAWDEAHKLFREKAGSRAKQSIEVDD
ncbi:hypothetical protein ACHAXT_000048 [Thalassiosira profunda]